MCCFHSLIENCATQTKHLQFKSQREDNGLAELIHEFVRFMAIVDPTTFHNLNVTLVQNVVPAGWWRIHIICATKGSEFSRRNPRELRSFIQIKDKEGLGFGEEGRLCTSRLGDTCLLHYINQTDTDIVTR